MEVTARLPHDLESGIAVVIDDSSQIGEARRTATTVATASGLSATDVGKFAIIATEAATNISKHATRGEIILRSVVGNGKNAAQLVAIDSGPGISDVERALGDGYSTSGTPGHGLGAISRLASSFDIFTAVGAGTVLSARVDADGGSKHAKPFDVGVIRVPKRGELDCGDNWSLVVREDGRGLLSVADGLGHGSQAAEASYRAVQIAANGATDQAGMVVASIHAALRPTRGAAVAVAELDPPGRAVRFAGLGNISGTIVGSGETKSLVSHNGIAGHEMRKIQEFEYRWPVDSLLVLHSDGVSTRWDLNRYPGLASRDVSVVAGVLYRDYSRGRDDALVVVVRAAV